MLMMKVERSILSGGGAGGIGRYAVDIGYRCASAFGARNRSPCSLKNSGLKKRLELRK
jgi:hypothetical protein